jgi:hypothetical protein
MAIHELEPYKGKYNWQEVFRQNPDEPVFDVPDWMRDMDHGRETEADAKARALAEAAEEYAAIAHLDE